jgi:small subunit ribosomal protein S20
MPNQPSAIKRMRSDAKKEERNQAILSELHNSFKKLAVLATSDMSKAKELGRALTSKFDKAVSYGTIPHRRADRKKARIARLLEKGVKS